MAIDALEIEEINEIAELFDVCFKYRTNTFTDEGRWGIHSLAGAMSNEARKNGFTDNDIRALAKSGYDKARL